MKHDQSIANKTAKQLLDQSSKDLSERHRLRLQQITTNAVTQYANDHRPNKRHIYIRRLTIPLAMASSILIVFWLWWPGDQPGGVRYDPSVAKAPPADATVPEWVMDTSVPISLLNNRAFYDWLDKHGQTKGRG